MRVFDIGALALLSCGVALSHTRAAEACGGCFHGAGESQGSIVTGHRMALSVSPVQTVLWDQVEYSGDPKDFAWVLPVGPGAYIEASTDAWFEALDAVTATRVESRVVTCANGRTIQQQDRPGRGCGAPGGVGAPEAADSDAETETRHAGGNAEVAVEHEGTVGPYETVTLEATDALALHSWLTDHGYAVPDDIKPMLDAYIAEGSEFIALRLAPGAGVRQMTPVRVVTPGASPTLPLRMVAAGTGASTSIVLYVLTEGRYHPQTFPDVTIDYTKLAWDWTLATSNYSQLRSQALGSGAKDGFLTTFAIDGALHRGVTAPDGTETQFRVGNDPTRYARLADLYFGRAAANDSAEPCAAKGAFASSALVVDTCTDAGCEPPPPGMLAADDFACGGYDDIAMALVGMHPRDVWLTRLEAELPRAALGEDLALEAATQDEVEPWHVAQLDATQPCSGLASPPTESVASHDDSGCGCATPGRHRWPFGVLEWAVATSFGLLAARRITRRKRAARP